MAQLFEVVLPVDDVAEETMAGHALAALEGAALAMQRLAADDFRDPRCWRVIVACADLTAVTDPDERIERVSERTGVPAMELRRWESGRWCFADKTGSVAARVRRAATERRRVFEALAVLDELGVARPIAA